MGIPKEQADIDARACGGSPSIWRIWNLVSLADPGNEIPEWASPERSVLVIPAVLLGGWSERFEGDRNVIELITGKSYEEYRNQLNPFISTDNPLLTKVSDAWVITAPATAFALTVRYITQSHLEALATVAKVVFLEIDPTIDLPDDERPYAALKGVGMKHSTWLRDGLAGALLLISVIGEQLERNGAIPSGGTCQSYVDSIVRELPGLREDWRVLASLRDKLPVLAEAAPVPFVEALECLLQGDPEKLQPILKEGKGFLSPAAFHTGLLWALETLAWEPRFLSRVALILAKLAEIDPGGRLANRPANSLKEILLAWHPGTSASLVQRLQTLDLLLERFDRIGWDLLSSILPKGSDVASPTHEPEWKDFGRSQKERLTNGIVRNTYENYVVRAIRHAKKVPDRWNTLIETCDDVSDESQRLIENGLLEVSEAGLSALDQTTIWESLRRFLNKHRAYAGASWALPEERLKRLESVKGRFDPENVVDEVAWLFNEDFPDLPFAKTNYETERCELDELRTDAVRKVWGSGGTQRIRLLVSKVSHVGLIGFHLLTFVDDRTIVVQLVDEMNRGNDKEQFFSRCLSGSAYEKFGSGWIDLLLSKARDARWSPEQTVNVLLNFSDSHQTFDLLESLGKEVERLYWAGRPRWLRSKENDVIARGIGKFEENGYAIDALIVARQQWKAKDPIVVLRLLDKALAELNDAKVEKLTRESYWIAELFNWLRTHGDIDAREIARREYAYLPLLTDQTRKIDLALHEILAIDPEFFVQVLTDLYKPASKTIDDYARTKDSHLRAKFAWKVLTSWKHPPGVDRRGCVIPGKLKEWVEKTRELAAGSDRGDVADREIGKILFHFPADPDDSVWPHLELRQLLETLRNENIESGIEIEQFNARGVVNKELFEGGVQERMLAQEWRTRGEQLGVRWPRSRAMCERIASQWESDAKEEDERADKRRLRMF